MGNALLRATLVEVKVQFNGDPKDGELEERFGKKKKELEERIKDFQAALAKAKEKDRTGREDFLERRIKRLKKREMKLKPSEDNVLTTTLSYPRSGTNKVQSMKSYDLKSGGEPIRGKDPDDFLTSGFFKEEIQGESLLQISISDKDPTNKVIKFFRDLAAALVGDAFDDLADDISSLVVSESADLIAGDVEDAIEGNDDDDGTETVIAKSPKIRLAIDNTGKLLIGDHKDVHFTDSKLTVTLRAPEDLKMGKEKTLKKGEANGQVIFKLTADPMAT